MAADAEETAARAKGILERCERRAFCEDGEAENDADAAVHIVDALAEATELLRRSVQVDAEGTQIMSSKKKKNKSKRRAARVRAENLMTLANALTLQCRFEEAELVLAEARALASKAQLQRLALTQASAAWNMGAHDDAAEYLLGVLAGDEFDDTTSMAKKPILRESEVLLLLGVCLQEQQASIRAQGRAYRGRYEEHADQAFEDAFSKRRDRRKDVTSVKAWCEAADTWYNLATRCQKENQTQLSIKATLHGLNTEQGQQCPRLWLHLAFAYKSIGDDANAEQAAATAFHLRPMDARARVALRRWSPASWGSYFDYEHAMVSKVQARVRGHYARKRFRSVIEAQKELRIAACMLSCALWETIGQNPVASLDAVKHIATNADNLVELGISGAGADPSVSEHIWERVEHGELQSLRTINLQSTASGNLCADAHFSRALFPRLLQASQLSTVRLCAMQLGDASCEAIVVALAGSPRLRRLGLEGNEIGDRGACTLAGLAVSLEELDLRANRIGDNGAQALAEATTRPGSRLSALHLAENFVTEVGALVIRGAARRGTLHDVTLHSNFMLFSDFQMDANAVAGKGNAKSGIDQEECRKKRQEVSVQIRKSRREDNLRKRRQTANQEVTAPSTPAKEGANASNDAAEIPAKLSALPQMLQAMQDGSAEQRIAGTKALRKLLSKPTDPPVQEVIDAGFLPYLCQFLQCHDDTALQFEAAWALTNVGSSDLTESIVEVGVLPLLVPLLNSAEPSVREQAAWCVGNVAGDCSSLRDQVLATPGLPEGLLANLQQPANVSMMRNVTWAVSNLCRGSKPRPALNMVAPYVPVLARIIESSGDEEATVDACWALSYVSDGENERLDAIVQTGVCPTLVKLLRSGMSKCVPPCLRTLGNIVTGEDKHTQAAIDAGLLRELQELFQHPKMSIRKEVAWTCSNVTAGTKEQIGALLAMPGLPEAMVDALEHGEWHVRKEAAWAVANICSGGATEHVRCVVERYNALKPMCALLAEADTRVLVLMMTSLETILAIDEERYGLLIEEYGGLEHLENLQGHKSDEVYQKARQLIENFFSAEDDDDDSTNVAPGVDESGSMFSFGTTTMNDAAPADGGFKPMTFGDMPQGAAAENGFNFAPIDFS
ncbi:Importin subunit alpha [Hondaea fermentalgiana]|uniref:Protein unc-45 homolog B n=1 Tax=Hondaea fermentalgiana TaxID=2315210 RepID=A0A2R5GYA6_9STRA|nr:Importin subunit alpha [Hondaea fermentalgiana]|eukprot:GBG33431.1 Importin subunit alpha [Hondaea fermentalgiana]